MKAKTVRNFKEIKKNILFKVMLFSIVIFSLWLFVFLYVQNLNIKSEVAFDAEKDLQYLLDAYSSAFDKISNQAHELENSQFIMQFCLDNDIHEKTSDIVSIQKYITDFTTVSVLGTDYVTRLGIYSLNNDTLMWGNTSSLELKLPDEQNLNDFVREAIKKEKNGRAYIKMHTVTSFQEDVLMYVDKITLDGEIEGATVFLIDLGKFPILDYDVKMSEIYDDIGNLILRTTICDNYKSFKKLSLSGYEGYTINAYIDFSDKILEKYFEKTPVFIFMIIGFIIVVVIAYVISLDLLIPYKRIEQILENPREIYEAENGELEYDYIISSVKKLVGSKYLAESQVVEKIKELQSMQIAVLQEQIKPHFLFNSLQIISLYSDELSGAGNKISDMIHKLSKMMKYTFSSTTYITPLRDEIEYVKNYLLFQKVRYHEEFDAFYDIPKEIENLKIIKMSFQPIVENAIYHGIRYSKKKCFIKFKGCISGDKLIFEISNSGTMISDDDIDKLNNELYDEKIDNEHIGLKNVNKRIKLLFGEQYGIYMKKGEIGETIVVFELPVIYED